MTTEEKYNLLLSSLKTMRIALASEKAMNAADALKQSIKGWSIFCGFFDAYTEVLDDTDMKDFICAFNSLFDISMKTEEKEK